ncbi:hypothetical protein [Entomobacter blattae]|nr:hypothetical protein [Entomobacter blattae]
MTRRLLMMLLTYGGAISLGLVQSPVSIPVTSLAKAAELQSSSTSVATNILSSEKDTTFNKVTVLNKSGEKLIDLVNGETDEIAGEESSFFGGYKDNNGNKLSHGLYISAQPYGPVGAGCALCLIASQDSIQEGGGRPAISGVDYREGARGVHRSGNYDQVGLYEYIDNTKARMVLDVESYSSDGLTLKTSMTEDQMNRLHRNMYIQTNSMDTTLAETGLAKGEIPTMRNYFSYVRGWDSKHIYVTGWAVPGIGSDQVGQVPSAIYDIYRSDYKKPVVFVGAPDKSFGRNLFMMYDGNRATAQATSPIHNFEAEEIDMFITNETRPHSVSFHGVTISPVFGGPRPDPSVLTTDSYDMLLAGDLPNHLLVNEASGNNVIKSNSFYVHGNEGVGRSGTGYKQKRIGFEYDAYADNGSNNLRFVHYLSKENTEIGWYSTAMHLALVVDGTQGDIDSGTNEGEIVWNRQSNNGGLELCGGSGACGIRQNFDGSVLLGNTFLLANSALSVPMGASITFSYSNPSDQIAMQSNGENSLQIRSQKGSTVKLEGLKQISIESVTYDGLGTKPSAGTQRYCSNCFSRLAGISFRGIPVWWNGSSWTDSFGYAVMH